jgi:Na+/melibiose symporter-like transporter
MILGSFILIYSFYSLINPNENFAKLWLFSYSVLIYVGWSMINIPYLTWSSEISANYEDKTILNSSRELFTILGVLTALIIPYIYEVSSDSSKTLNILFLSFLIIFIPFFIMSLANIKIDNTCFIEKFSFKKLELVYKNISDLKFLQIGYFFNTLANALPSILFLLFIEFVIQEKDLAGLILILYFFSGVVALPFWNILANKIGKKKAWISSIILASSAFIFVPFLQEGDLIAFIIISIVSGLSLGADMALPTSIQSDLIQKTHTMQTNIAGLLFGIWTMITKFSLALAVALSFIILGFFDFEATNPNESSLLVLSLLYGLLPVILKIIAIFFISKYSDIKDF